MSDNLDNLFYRQPNKFRFTLIENFTKRSILPNAPRNWQNNLINWARSDTYFGMIRSFTVPMDFVLDGAWILRNQFYTHGIGAQVELLIEKFNSATYLYETLYRGDIDFANFKDSGSKDGYVVTCNVVQSGITKFVKAYEETKYSIPLDDPGSVTIQFNPIKLDETCQFQIQNTELKTVEDFFPGVNIVTNQQRSTIASVYPVGQFATPPIDFSTAGNYIYFAQTTGMLSCTGFISGQTNKNQQFRIRLMKNDNSTFFTIMDEIRVGMANDFNKPIQFSLPITAGDKLFLWCDVPGGVNNGDGFVIGDGEMLFSYKTSTAATTAKAFRAGYLFQRLMEKMNNNLPVSIQSHLLNDPTSKWYNLLITCGDAIRPVLRIDVNAGDSLIAGQKYQVAFGTVRYGLATYTLNQIFVATPSFTSFTTTDDGYCQTDNKNPAIITSFSDFFKAINSRANIGWGVEVIGGVETSVLEAKNYFYKANLIASDIGEVGSFNLSVYQNYLFNTIKYGYEDQTYDNVNGGTEFNSTAYAASPIDKIKKELDLISPYRADSIGIESLRINLSNSGNGQSNTSPNNDVFMVMVDPTPVSLNTYIPYIYPIYSGVSTNAYNMDLSPKRGLLNHGDYLHGVLDKLDGENIIFTSGLKNINLRSTDANGVTILESDNIYISSLPTKLFLPYLAEVTAKEPVNMLDMIDKYPTGCIKFSVDGNTYTGFIIDCNTDTDQNKPQKLKLLLTANNVMGNFIR